jgi:hypothetical protein
MPTKRGQVCEVWTADCRLETVDCGLWRGSLMRGGVEVGEQALLVQAVCEDKVTWS